VSINTRSDFSRKLILEIEIETAERETETETEIEIETETETAERETDIESDSVFSKDALLSHKRKETHRDSTESVLSWPARSANG